MQMTPREYGLSTARRDPIRHSTLWSDVLRAAQKTGEIFALPKAMFPVDITPGASLYTGSRRADRTTA